MKQDMYQFTTNALRGAGLMTPLRIVIGLVCISMTPVVLTMQFNPLGPHELIPRVIQLIFGTLPTAVGLLWIFGSWPTFRQSLLFVLWADVSMVIGTSMNTATVSRLDGIYHMGLIGIYIAFILGPAVLAAHCTFVLVAMIVLSAYSVVVDHAGWGDLYVFLAPAISSLILLPILIQALIEGARRTAWATVQQVNIDPLTGLRNRRGMYARADELMQSDSTVTLVAAIIDLDRFKELNDEYGHDRGDLALKAVAGVLAGCIRDGDIAARLGGDEFGVLVTVNSSTDATAFVDRLRTGLQEISDTVTASVGIVCGSLPLDGADDVDSVLRHADRAMYEAKRQGGNRFVEFDPWGAPDGAPAAADRHVAPLIRHQKREHDHA
ncbi:MULTISPECIES: GGDEF domain-containing protein [unclassified Mycolicibacterium]|uniref:GGDEF domain-containing protein n=1 Tax=unclassified Mycolicibacterium TaxID=2636767 RepID=UPI0013913D8C|nr:MULTISPECIES: GGDEF domain-containing protein [unclassified Mycolicibacterium]